VRAVAADQVPRSHGALSGLIADRGGDPVVVLGEAHKLDPTPYPRAVLAQRLSQDPLCLVLGQCDEVVRDVVRQLQLEPRCLRTVDERKLSPHRHCGVQRAPGQSSRVPELHRPRLDADGFGVGRRGKQTVDHHHLDPAPTQLEGRRQPNRTTANDEHLGVHDQTLPRQTETSQAIAAVTAMPMLYLTPMIEDHAVPAYHALRNLRVSAFGALRSHASVINTQSSSGLAASRVTMTHDKRLPQ